MRREEGERRVGEGDRSFEVDTNLISKKSVTMMNDTPAVMH